MTADALVLKVREGGRVVNVHALVASGVNADGHREILGVQVSSAENRAGWLTFFRDLAARGLSGVTLVTSHTHQGLVAAISATVPGASCNAAECILPTSGLCGFGLRSRWRPTHHRLPADATVGRKEIPRARSLAILDAQRLSWWQRAADDALFDDGQPGDEVLTRTSSLADMYDQYGVELTAAAVQFPVRHPVVAAVVAGTQRRTSCLDVAASVGRRPGRGLA